jgi:hypothetical protein
MRVLLLHLSDAHFSNKQFLSEPQTRALAAAVLGVDSHPDAICVVLSGDVAATGSSEDYAIASKFIEELLRIFQNVVPSNALKVISVPGNHDLTDSVLGEARETLANDILQNNQTPTSAPHTYEILLSGQANYWAFDQQWTTLPAKTVEDKIFRTIEVVFGNLSLYFGVINTAFLSSRHETQGRLWFPVSLTRGATPRNSIGDAFSIAVFHHPYGWLESNNAVAFRQFVEANFDVALNGHQHTPESYYSASLQSSQIWYSAGAALIGKSSSESGFTVLSLDTDTRTRKLTQFSWNGTLYLAITNTDTQPLETIVNRRGITLTEDFAGYLDDTESLVVHSQKKHVLLQDVFETPRLRGGESKAGSRSRTFSADKISVILRDNEATFIFGETLSGKTCLGKDIFRQLFRRDGTCVPVFLSAREIESAKIHDIDRWCSRAVRTQYRGISAPEYQVMPREKKVAIVDDWHALSMNQAAKRTVMKELCARHKHAILLCDSWYQAQELAIVLDSDDPLLPKNHYVILPLTAYQRSSMARRWLSIGRPDNLNDSDLIFQLDAAEKYLDELNRSRLMPPHPLYVLSALQTLQAVRQSEPDFGAQGVLFDILIGDKLAAMSEDAPELDINRQFLAFVAHDIFSREARGITEQRIRELEKTFLHKFAVPVKLDALLRMLTQHKVFHCSDGFISFRHRYMYYYFVAEHFVAALAKRATKLATLERLKEMAEFLAYEEYAQVLMFIIYKTRNEDLIDELISKSQKVFSMVKPSDLDSDVMFANRLDIHRTNLSLPSESVAENRSARRLEMAEPEDLSQPTNEDDSSKKVAYSDELDWAAKLQYAFKTTQMLGRVLRNFPGTLDADQKRQLAIHAYGASLRMLRDILAGAEKDQENLRAQLAEATDESDTLTPTERFQLADARLSALVVLCGYAIVRFISTAVGSSKLEITFDEIRKEFRETPSILLVDLAVRLENFRDIPIETLFELDEKLGKNFVAHQILRMLVWQRVTYLPMDDRKLRSRICDRFQISSSSTPVLIANASSFSGGD